MAGTRRGAVPAIILLVAGLLAGGVSAAETPRAFIERLGNKTVEILDTSRPAEERQKAVGGLLREAFDFDTVSRLVLGRFWREATPQQRTDYQDAFTTFVVQTYSQRLADSQIDDFAITGVRKLSDGDSLVETVIKQPDQPPAEFGWRVREDGGDPKLVDVVVDGVSMVISKRSEFASVVQREGMEGLIQSLRTKTMGAKPA